MIPYKELQKLQEKYPQMELVVTESGYQIACQDDIYDQVLSELDALKVTYQVYKLVEKPQ